MLWFLFYGVEKFSTQKTKFFSGRKKGHLYSYFKIIIRKLKDIKCVKPITQCVRIINKGIMV